MSRVLNVIRLQLVNRQTFIWVPLIILGGAVALSILIYAMIPVDTPKYGGGGQAPLWYFFALGIQSLTLTFPFSQALSVTRRDFFLGTIITAIGASLLMSLVFVGGGLIEEVTRGWFVNGYVFRLPWIWDSGVLGALVISFALSMLLFVLGFTGATIYKTWGPMATAIAGIGAGLILAALVVLVTRLQLWGQVGSVLGSLGAIGVALWGLVGIAVLTGISFLLLRRAKP